MKDVMQPKWMFMSISPRRKLQSQSFGVGRPLFPRKTTVIFSGKFRKVGIRSLSCWSGPPLCLLEGNEFERIAPDGSRNLRVGLEDLRVI
ncbi:hypothetical protein CEXT_394221 [Caerostris extrusa]|uniref:Uncharacterized protein n=1 Tax=Caerostris extrusa TaxID=172846 RepID=A0AAV4XP28_CAEEX|nr:hypothetical protein CEXT_394221 [Caerostris extrusa]